MAEIIKYLDENIVKRILFPSSMFILVFFIYLSYENNLEIIYELNKKLNIWEEIIIFIGISYILNIISQAIYDNRIKQNYDTKYLYKEENSTLELLREKVIIKLNIFDEKFYTDYILYNILASDKDTKRYVDDTKSIAIFFVSIIILLIFIYFSSLLNKDCFGIVIEIFSVFFIYFLGVELIKAKYRSRAIRLYINYLNNDLYFKSEK